MKTIPNIPIVYRRFPDNYINDVNGWAFDKKTLIENKGKLLTLDIDYGSYCSLNCPLCFRLNNTVDAIERELKFEDLVNVIKEAKSLGLRSVKFLGKGEPLESDRFLEFLAFLHSENIISLIFTKGHVIGDDDMVKKYYSKYNINTGEQLVNKLNQLNASIMLGFNSFDNETQLKMVGNFKGYIEIRNKALELLVNAGFNKNNPTRLALAINPITRWNINEAFEIYKWGRMRNLYCIVTPPMISGRSKEKSWVKITPTANELIKLYTKIYKFNIKYNLQTKEQIKNEGISSYAGGHPCNQVSCGLYISLNGIVLKCPGNEEAIEGNVWDRSIEDIWNNSSNKNMRSGRFNNQCIAKDGKTIPKNLYQEVMRELCK